MKELENAALQNTIRANVEKVRSRIIAACTRSNRDIAAVKLIAVSKNFPSRAVRIAFGCGVHDFGENRVQEACSKFEELDDIRQSIHLHFIGHLQTNKVKDMLQIADVIHSIDSPKLARVLNDRSSRRLSCLIQVNIAGEMTKSGFANDELDVAVKEIRTLPNIDILGLMTIAPIAQDHEEVRPVFARLRELNEVYGFRELSMGMTDDYEVAIEEGSTMVRIGRAIFGERS